jgi:hypothetical protein
MRRSGNLCRNCRLRRFWNIRFVRKFRHGGNNIDRR